MSTFQSEDLQRVVSNVLKFCPARTLYPYVELIVGQLRVQALAADRYAIATDMCTRVSDSGVIESSPSAIILHRDQASELETWLRALKKREVHDLVIEGYWVYPEGAQSEFDATMDGRALRMRVWDDSTDPGEWIEESWEQDERLEQKWVKHFESCHAVLRKAGGLAPKDPWRLQPHRLTALASVKVDGVSADDKAMEITPMEGVNTLRVSMGDTFRALLQPLEVE